MRFRYRLTPDKEYILLKIRLRRMGLRNRPAYRVVVIDSRKARDGKYLESVGHYDPRTKLLELKTERIEHWVSKGAQTSDTVGRLVSRYTRQQTTAAETATSDEVGATPASAEPVAAEPASAEPVAAEPISAEPASTPESATPTDTPKE
jgi:small subunit ribosomal protein S16